MRQTEAKRLALNNVLFSCGRARPKNKRATNKHRSTSIAISRNLSHPNLFASDFFKNASVENRTVFSLF